jgi:N-formylglutamate amidohydrolase
MKIMAECFERAFDREVAINDPFSGGYITRHHGRERPWVQVELSRAPFLTDEKKRTCVLLALADFCRIVLSN